MGGMERHGVGEAIVDIECTLIQGQEHTDGDKEHQQVTPESRRIYKHFKNKIIVYTADTELQKPWHFAKESYICISFR